MGRIKDNSKEIKLIKIQGIIIREVDSEALLECTKEIFLEYQESIDTDLCFQKFEEELTSLPGKYSYPSGRLYLAFSGEAVVGCVALRPIKDEKCEMKRLYIKPEYRGQGFGRILAEKIISDAKEIGYKQVFLDTLDTMKSAIKLYHSLGFKNTQSYCYNPLGGAIFMSLDL